ncbi:WD repeat-containing and planar cell polarity effector protein fritz homolog [Neoarius graeffei]|uniref:WD repeat-containing and planar cell polarity effector protein fritz homolog n=1 Tax=Neoarius graeffei TaxID=443677 RepID=UPI00298C98D8|nr:WD repeat-containing and planar cell polarity effector protein fritz homolog [Neoarius graeffei]XP_060789413.1 WD repeat-containing and planar cell polarity effector protein fritz homolog [Neoarius graeffei]
MAFCLTELTLWSSRSSLNVQDTDIGTFQFYEKGERVFPADQHYYTEKQHFAETRGYPWFLSNRRPERLRDALKELEDLLQSNSCVCTKWRTKQCCQMLLSSGVLVTLTLSGAQLERVGIDKTLVGRLPADTISHAAIGERFLLLSFLEKSQVCQVYLGRRSQSSPELSARRLEKLSAADIKVSSLELAGGGSRRISRRVALNRAQDVGVCWWQGGHDEVWPWSPVPSASDRANLVLLGFSESPGLMILSSIRTHGEPLDCCFSLTQPYQILTVELHKEAHSSSADLHEESNRSNMELREEAQVCQSCVYECTRERLQHLSATALPLSSVPVSWCRDPSERWLLLGLQDSSVVLLHIETGLQTRVTCPMLPSVMEWHPDGGLIVVAGGQGELQCFDLGLSPLRLQLVSEEEGIGTSLQLARHVRIPGGLEGVEWAHSPLSQGAEGLEVHDLLMIRFHRGPVAALRLRLGVLNGAQLGPGEVLQHRLRCGEVDAALGILGNMDWCMMGADCYRGLISVTDHLLRKALDEQTEAQLEAALGMFYSPSRALTDTVILEYRDPISRYARRFFHHLLRHRRFEKAFLLALDIGARDLFMDLHYVARDSGEPVLANVARRKAEALDVEGVTTSNPDEPKPVLKDQNGVCVSPINTHAEWANSSKAHKNTSLSRVDSTGKMEDDLAATPVNPTLWPWTQTEFELIDHNDQVSKDSGKLKVIHLGLV